MIQTKHTTITDELANITDRLMACFDFSDVLSIDEIRDMVADEAQTIQRLLSTRPKETPTEQGEVTRESLVEAVAREMCKRQGYFDPDSVREEWSDGRKVLAWQQFADDARESIEILAALSHTNMQVAEKLANWRRNLAITQGSPVVGDVLHGAALDFVIEQIDSILSTITASSTTEVSTSSPSGGMVHE